MAWLINRPAGTHQRSVVPWGPHATEVSRGVITEFVVGGRTRTNASAEGEKSATAGIEPGSRHSEAAALPTELKLLFARLSIRGAPKLSGRDGRGMCNKEPEQ